MKSNVKQAKMPVTTMIRAIVISMSVLTEGSFRLQEDDTDIFLNIYFFLSVNHSLYFKTDTLEPRSNASKKQEN